MAVNQNVKVNALFKAFCVLRTTVNANKIKVANEMFYFCALQLVLLSYCVLWKKIQLSLVLGT